MGLLITLLVVVLFLVVVFWLVGALVTDARSKQIIQVIVAVVVLAWLITVLLGYAPHIVVR